jgi:hypothetical protein
MDPPRPVERKQAVSKFSELDDQFGVYIPLDSASGQPTVFEQGTARNVGSNPALRYHVFQCWKWEIMALLFSAGLIAAVFALLVAFDGQRVPDWGFAINLSTLLALLATIFRATMVMVQGKIISQAKWAWFSGEKARPLQHFQEFDDGSRGVFGAAFLLPKVMRHNLVAGLAGLAMIASLAIGSFVQQAIRSKSCAHPMAGDIASIPYAHYVPRQMVDQEEGQFQLFGASGQDMEVAIFMSSSTPEASQNQINPVCTTGNCTFPIGDPVDGKAFNNSGGNNVSFSTAGLCRSCIDVSPMIQLLNATGVGDTNSSVQYSLPTGQEIDWESFGTFMTAETSNLTWAEDVMTSEFAEAARWSFANITVMAYSAVGCGQGPVTSKCGISADMLAKVVAPNATARAMAVSCAIYPCVRRYTSSIINNKLSESQLDTALMTPSVQDSQCIPPLGSADENEFCHYTKIQSPCLANGIVYTTQNMSSAPNSTALSFYEEGQDGSFSLKNVSAPEQCIYRHDAALGKIVHDNLQTIMFTNTSCQMDPRVGSVSCGNNNGLRSTKWATTVYNDGNATLDGISSYFESFVASMTNQYRVTFGSAIYNGSRPQTDLDDLLPLGEVQGVVWQSTVCNSMKWEWLLLPVAIWLITAALLAASAAKSWRHRHTEPVWKDNVLPGMLYRERFRGIDGSAVGPKFLDEASGQGAVAMEKQGDKLLETKEIEKIASRALVRFQWGEHGSEGLAETTSSHKEGFEMKSLMQRRGWPLNQDAGASRPAGESLLANS